MEEEFTVTPGQEDPGTTLLLGHLPIACQPSTCNHASSRIHKGTTIAEYLRIYEESSDNVFLRGRRSPDMKNSICYYVAYLI